MPDIDFLYRDADLVAVNKPSGLAVHRGWADDDEFAMTLVRDALGQWVYPVHRLDRGASGVLLFGLSPQAARALCECFEAREVEKTYWALVRGRPPIAAIIDHPLRPERGDTAQPALTHVRLLAQLGRYASVEAKPLTGRLHQIRRHMKHISCPLIGDVRYGKGEHNRWFRERYALHRLALHAAALTLPRWHGSEALHIEAPLPSELQLTLDALTREASVAETPH